jgi:shikimate 5-dehydrogenase
VNQAAPVSAYLPALSSENPAAPVSADLPAKSAAPAVADSANPAKPTSVTWSRVGVLSRNSDRATQTLGALLERYRSAAQLGNQADPAKPLCGRTPPPLLPLTLCIGDYSEAPELLAKASLLVDATGRSMHPELPPIIDPALLRPTLKVMDCVYGQGESPLLQAAAAAGAQAIDGRAMLVEQAALSLEFWAQVQGLDVTAPLETMYAAAQ